MTDAPDASASVPAAPAAPPAAPAAVVPPAPVKKRRALGAWSFVLGFLAAISHIVMFVAILVTLGSVFTNLGNGPDFGLDALGPALAAAAGLAILGIIVFWGAIGFAVLSIILAIAAFIRRSGPVLAVFGLLFSLGVLGVSLAVGSAIGSVPDLFNQ